MCLYPDVTPNASYYRTVEHLPAPNLDRDAAAVVDLVDRNALHRALRPLRRRCVAREEGGLALVAVEPEAEVGAVAGVWYPERSKISCRGGVRRLLSLAVVLAFKRQHQQCPPPLATPHQQPCSGDD